MRRKLLIGTVSAIIFSIATSTMAWAGTWQEAGPTWKYVKDDGAIAISEWITTDGKWYHFDNNGIMETGWIMDNEKFYFLGGDGQMYANRLTPTGYYLGEDGAWIKDYIPPTTDNDNDDSSYSNPNHQNSGGSSGSTSGNGNTGGSDIHDLDPGITDGPK